MVKSGQKYHKDMVLVMAGFHGKGGGQRVVLASPINYLVSHVLNLWKFDRLVVLILCIIGGGAAHRTK